MGGPKNDLTCSPAPYFGPYFGASFGAGFGIGALNTALPNGPKSWRQIIPDVGGAVMW